MKKLLVCLILFVVLYNCVKDDEANANEVEGQQNETTDPNDITFRENFGKVVKASFEGHVKDDFNESVANAKVTIGDKIVFTNEKGFFKIDDAQVYEFFSYIKVSSSSNYGYKTIVPVIGKTNRVDIIALKINHSYDIVSSGEMSEIPFDQFIGGKNVISKIILPGDYINASGDPYTGDVRVYTRYLLPNEEDTFTRMPGMLLAQDAENNLRGLETYGMMSVKLYSTEGELLNIANGSKATLEFPIDTSTPNAPETIPLWYFDEEVGYWKEDGQAIKRGDKYIGEVSHFTWWNCDVPINEVVNGCISFTYNNRTNLLENWVEIIRNDNSQTVFGGTIYTNGEICGLLPKTALTVNIYASVCDKTLRHSQEITPSETNKTFAITTNELPSSITTNKIIGVFTNCKGDPLTNGVIVIQKRNRNKRLIIPITESHFNYDFVYCPEEEFSIRVIDYDTGLTSEGITLNLKEPIIDLGEISTCSNGSGTYNGDVSLNTQAEVDAFGQLKYAKINGDLLIGLSKPEDAQSDIVDLKSLASLVEIFEGNLKIQFNPFLNSLEGLNNLVSIHYGLTIMGNQSLVSLQGLNSLTSLSIRGLSIDNNDSLTSLEGLQNLSSTFRLNINDNDKLLTLSGLENLTYCRNELRITNNNSLASIKALSNAKFYEVLTPPEYRGPVLKIIGNNSLVSLDGLEGLTIIHSYLVQDKGYSVAHYSEISENPKLISIDALKNVVIITTPFTIKNNNALGTLNGLDNLELLPDSTDGGLLEILDCKSLNDYCAFQESFYQNPENNKKFEFSGNKYNPTVENLIDGNCSQ